MRKNQLFLLQVALATGEFWKMFNSKPANMSLPRFGENTKRKTELAQDNELDKPLKSHNKKV